MDYEDILQNIKNGKYDPDVEYPNDSKRPLSFVTDENMSVKWNIEAVKRYNADIDNRKMEYRISVQQSKDRFKSDCCEFINASLNHGFKLNNNDLSKLYNKAYDEGHSSGMYTILQFCEEYVEVINIALSSIYG